MQKRRKVPRLFFAFASSSSSSGTGQHLVRIPSTPKCLCVSPVWKLLLLVEIQFTLTGGDLNFAEAEWLTLGPEFKASPQKKAAIKKF